ALLTRQCLVEQHSTSAHRVAEQAMCASTLGALKQTAVYKAIEATASGFQALGGFDFWAAAQDFASAALWGTIAGAQVASAAGAGAGQSRALSTHYAHSQSYGQSGGLGEPVSVLATGAAGAAHPPDGHLTVAIMGEPEAGQWLATTLNTAVEQRGVQLTASRSMQTPYAQG
ncbi:MAG: hypothetical protein ACRD10_08775, partial [Terriglobia bacterium]